MLLSPSLLGDMTLIRHFLRILKRPTLGRCSEYRQGKRAVSTPAHALFNLVTTCHISALRNIPCCGGPHSSFSRQCRRHCWFPSTVAWERDFSVRSILQRIRIWGSQLPLLFATWIARDLKPLLLSISEPQDLVLNPVRVEFLLKTDSGYPGCFCYIASFTGFPLPANRHDRHRLLLTMIECR